MRSASRWAALCTGSGGGERVKIERYSKRNGYGWGGGRKEGGNNNPEKGRRKRWGGRARLKSNNKRRILGLEWSMYKFGTPPPHNSDKPCRLLNSINNNNNNNPQRKSGCRPHHRIMNLVTLVLFYLIQRRHLFTLNN